MKIHFLACILLHLPLGAIDYNSSFIAKQNGKVLVTIGNCDIQNPPCSTFKIALALMGFDSGILIDKDTPKWPFKPEYENNFPSWYTTEAGKKSGWHQEHTPETFIAKSVLWFSHQITKRLGKERFQDYAHRLNYGNRDVTGTPGQDDGLLNSWLETSLKISPQEQVELLEKMLNCELDLCKDAQEKTKELMAKKDENNLPIEWEGWRLSGRTGGGTGCHRWFIGWVEQGDENIIFAQYIGLIEDTPENRASAPIAIDAAKENVTKLLQRLMTPDAACRT